MRFTVSRAQPSASNSGVRTVSTATVSPRSEATSNPACTSVVISTSSGVNSKEPFGSWRVQEPLVSKAFSASGLKAAIPAATSFMEAPALGPNALKLALAFLVNTPLSAVTGTNSLMLTSAKTRGVMAANSARRSSLSTGTSIFASGWRTRILVRLRTLSTKLVRP